MSGDHIHTSIEGVDWFMSESEDGRQLLFEAAQDLTDLLERNRTAQTHIDGYTASKEMRLAATIPASVRLKWLTEEGWDCFSPDPGCQKKLAQKLDSSDWRHLRCAEFRIGDNYLNGRQ